jgi:hypothetical protein
MARSWPRRSRKSVRAADFFHAGSGSVSIQYLSQGDHDWWYSAVRVTGAKPITEPSQLVL